ncbi:MAG TPA: DUF5103 domain-containing protein [Salinimicrobium sp.]|nr:DUF5103 domain-containing protein [Salinimicrobium sp.]
MRTVAPLLLFFILPFISFSQITETPPPNFIKTISFGSGNNWGGIPIIKLGKPIILEFDDIIGDEADYYYSIEHFNFDWTPSGLAESEYLEGFDNIRISNYENSFNTLQIYSHYSLRIPNTDTRALKLSGNYLLSILDANQNVVFSKKFIIYEPITKVGVQIKRSRDLSVIEEKQVVHFTINSEELILKNPEENVKTLVLQNGNLKSAKTHLKPQYTLGTELVYKYDQEASFWGGNEFLEFDNKDLRAATMNVRFVELEDLYHHYLFSNFVRSTRPYTYNPDINGGFLVRTLQGQNPDVEAEYVWVHFTLESYQPMGNGKLYIYGGFNHFNISEETELTYNYNTGLYETALLIKQGFYNYKYVYVDGNGEVVPGFVSGNFDETENEYQVVVYYRDIGGRYDRVIGMGTGNSSNITN